MVNLIRGWAGKPSHPPLTDASIGAYTAGVAALVAGKLGLEDRQMAYASLIAISVGLALAAPTALTGLLDWLKIERGTPRRTVATVHLITMVTATLLFAATWLAQRPGYVDGRIETLGLALGIAAEAVLTVGGYLGGALVFAYGVRVLKRPDAPIREALIPGGLGPEVSAEPDPGRPEGRKTEAQSNGGTE